MEREVIMLSEVSPAWKEKCHMISLIGDLIEAKKINVGYQSLGGKVKEGLGKGWLMVLGYN